MSSTPDGSPKCTSSRLGERCMLATGVALLVAWSGWWIASILSPEFRLLGGDRLWFPAMPLAGVPWPSFGLDFMYNFAGAATWADDGDPYAKLAFTFAEPRYVYPPFVIRAFSWTALFDLASAKWAILCWMAALTAMGVGAGVFASRHRRAHGTFELPPVLVVSAFLCSTPFLFSLERGNYDLLVLVLVMAAVGTLQHTSPAADVAAGWLLAAAAWLKLYPGLLIVGLVALGRPRAAASMAAAAVLVALADAGRLGAWIRTFSDAYANAGWEFANHAHSLTRNWPALWNAAHLPFLGRVPATLQTCVVVLPGLAVVCWRVFRSARRADLALPLMLWLGALATFIPVGAFDYNLVFLVMALLIAWDAALPWFLQALFAVQLVWMQPFALPHVTGWLTFWLKVAGVVAVGIVLARQAAARPGEASPVSPPERHSPGPGA